MEVVHHSLSVSLSVSVTYLAVGQSHTAEVLPSLQLYLRLESCSRRSLSPHHGASSGCGWRRRPPAMEGSYEYVE
jgi:hypothetical protein